MGLSIIKCTIKMDGLYVLLRRPRVGARGGATVKEMSRGHFQGAASLQGGPNVKKISGGYF